MCKNLFRSFTSMFMRDIDLYVYFHEIEMCLSDFVTALLDELEIFLPFQLSGQVCVELLLDSYFGFNLLSFLGFLK